ncbi:MAG: VaFE repeat-containing surface-anchored protein [Atopobiaceae bacterium]|jgi:hypothetical protein
MEKTKDKKRERLSAVARAALAAALALMVCVPARPAAATVSDANDAVVHIHSYEIENGDGNMNGGTGYLTSDGTVSYCYDALTHGPGAAGQDYSEFRDGTHATDYLYAHGYPATNEIGGKAWSDADAQGITQLAAWIVADTTPYKQILSFEKTSADKVAAAEALATEANAYQGGDKAINGCSSIAYCEGKSGIQPMLTGSLGGRVTLTKASGDASITKGDSDYSLAGATYGVYRGGKLVAQFTTDGDGHGQTDKKLKSGDYTVKEISAPDGYTLSDKEYQVTVSGKDASVDASDMPITVKIRVVKTDAETGGTDPQGAGSLDGAVYKATYEQNGEEASQEATIANGEATFENIPLGKITVSEVQAPTGYKPDTKSHEFTVTAADAGHEKAVFELTPADGEFSEQPVRGDLELVKVADTSLERLANVPFKVTSKTTGESHVLTTDANGYASTASAWNKHTQDTNGGTATSGVWFGSSEPDDSKGALLYDTYEIEEQRCESNADRALIPAFDVSVYKDSTTVNLGTLTDDEGPKIGTTATDAADGDHEAEASSKVTLNDDVTYTGLTPGKEYRLTGTLMDKETGKPVRQDGADVTAEAAFTPTAASGVATVTFEFDASSLANHETVVFEDLTQDGAEVATHANIDDEGQTVKIVPPAPKVGTTATDADDGDHEATADDSVTINDEVTYENLTPGQEYTLTGTLMDKSTGRPVQSDGKDVTSTVSFTPEKASGTQTVTFTFDGTDLGGHETAAFESLQKDGTEVAAHADINDEGQTVKLVPPSEEKPPSKGDTPATGMPKTGDKLPWVAALCAIGAVGCGAGIIALSKRRKGLDGADDDATDGESEE